MALAPTLPALVAGRAVQGAGAGARLVLARAVVRDPFPDPAQARAQSSSVNAVTQVAPVVAPPPGAVLPAPAGGAWRPLFAVLAVSGAALLAAVWAGLGESAPATDRHALRPGRLLANYGRFLNRRDYPGNAPVADCTLGCLSGYVSGSPPVFAATFGFGPAAFAAAFAGVSAGAFAAAALARRHVPARGTVRAALGGTLALLAPAPFPALPVLVPALGAITFCFGSVMPAAVQGASQPVPGMTGAAAAVLGCLRMLGGAASSALVEALFGPLGAAAMPAVMPACAPGGLAAHEAVARPAERTDRSQNPAPPH